MYYKLYLSSLCKRRHWSDPHYEPYRTTTGFCCTVRVNSREYQTDMAYESLELAKENAAMRAYLICRNFSMTDGMYPGGHLNGVVQGLPVVTSKPVRQSTSMMRDYSMDSPLSSSYTSEKSNSPVSDEDRLGRRAYAARRG